MDSQSIITILIMLALISLSALFSASETAFTSFNRSRIKNLKEKGNTRAGLVLKISENYDKTLSTILVGNNIVNISLASIATVFFVKYFNEDMGATIATIVTTIVVLIFGEISPKSISKDSPERVAMALAPLINVFIVLLTPINFLFSLWKKLLSKIFKVTDDRRVTEEELLTIVEEAEQEGGINENESELIRSAIEFNELDADDIYTPRVDVVAVRKGMSREEVEKLFAGSGYSRLPVYEDTIDNIAGLIHQKDFYNYADQNWENAIKAVEYVPATMKIRVVLKLLQEAQTHMAIIVDEYGGTQGILTMEDILEELVGEIWDEHDEIITSITQIDDTHYRVLGSADTEDLSDVLEVEFDTDSSTVSGWVMEQLGEVPNEGDNFDYQGLSVKVSKIDNNRVLEILLTVPPQLSAASE